MDNWYLVLELDFDPPENNETVIANRIEEKGRFWSQNFNHFRYGSQYRAWHDSINQIRKDMLGSENRRKELSEEAIEIHFKDVDEYFSVVALKGYVTDVELQNIADKCKMPKSKVDSRRNSLGIELRREQRAAIDYERIYQQYYSDSPNDINRYHSLPGLLRQSGHRDLYEFLHGSMSNPEKQTAEALRQRTREKRGEFVGHDQHAATGKQLCGHCDIVFSDEDAKKNYDNYLLYLRRKSILDRIGIAAGLAGGNSIDKANYDSAVKEITGLYRNIDLAKNIVDSYCHHNKLQVPVQENNTSTKLKVCRCGFTNDVSDGRKNCLHCGLPLTIQCPNCNKVIDDNSIRFCSCGFDLDRIDRAVSYCEQADKAIDSLNLEIAEHYINQAKSEWDKCPKIAVVESKYSNQKRIIGADISKLDSAIKNKRFFEAETVYKTIQRKFRGYRDERRETEIRDAINKAKALFTSAQKEPDKAKKRSLCNQAYEACKDYPGIEDYIRDNLRPDPPTNLEVTTDNVRRVNKIKWKASPSPGAVKYKVIKQLNSVPTSPSEGEIVDTVSMCSCEDKKIEPGQLYYYAVFADVANVFSTRPAVSRTAVANLFEVKNLSVAIGDSSLNLIWDKPPINANVHVYKVERGISTKIKTLTGSNYLITGLVNGSKYDYRVSFEYSVNGKQEETKGVTVSGIPDCPPRAVGQLSVQYDKDDKFKLTWSHIGDGEVRFYSSNNKPTFKPESTISLQELENSMSQLMVTMLPKTSSMGADQFAAELKYDKKDILYVAAVTVKGNCVVFGSVTQVAKGGNVVITSVKEINHYLYVYIQKPEKAVSFTTLWSSESYPTDLNDNACQRKVTRLDLLSRDGALKIPYEDGKKYYISVFAAFNNGGNIIYSSPANYTHNSKSVTVIYYDIVVPRFFGKVKIDFYSDEANTQLPEIDIVKEKGHMPFFYDVSKTISTVKSQKLTGTISTTFDKPKQTDIHVKPFIKDATDNTMYKLVKSKGDYKIT